MSARVGRRSAAGLFSSVRPGGVSMGAVRATSSTDDQQIRAAVRTFETGWNSDDMDGTFQAFTPDADWVNMVGVWWQGLSDVKRAPGMYHETMCKDTPYHIEEVQVRLLCSDAAIAVVRWKKGSFVPPDGIRLPESRDLMSTYLVKRSSGG